MTSTLSRTSSSASSRIRSGLPSAHRYSMAMVAALHIAQVAKSLAESFEGIRKYVWTVPQKADAVDLPGLLRAARRMARSRRGRRAAEQRDELAPPDRRAHSITSSARASSVGGTVEPERLGGLEVDDERELGRLLDRQVGGLGALEDLVDIDGGALVHVLVARPIGHQAARLDHFAVRIHARQPLLGGEIHHALAVMQEHPVRQDEERVRLLLDDRVECGVEVFRLGAPRAAATLFPRPGPRRAPAAWIPYEMDSPG